MKDRNVEHPNRYKLTLVSGTTDTYDFEAVPGTVTAAGTVLNKASLLTDATATALGLTSDDPTVSEALAALAGLGERYTTCSTAGATQAKTAALADFVLTTGPLVGVLFENSDTSTNPTLNINSTGAKAIYHYLTGTNVTEGDIVAGMTALLQYDGSHWILLNPSGGTTGNTKIAVGSYVGTGAAGSGSKNSIAVDFRPEIVMLFVKQLDFGVWYGATTATLGTAYWGKDWIQFIRPQTQLSQYGAPPSGGTVTYRYFYPTWGDAEVSWYGAYYDYQFNTSGTTYYYVILGV